MQELLHDVAARASAYLGGLERRKVAPDPAAVAALDALDGPLPQAACDPREVIAMLDGHGSAATMAMAGPRFFGFVIGGALPAALAANWLASAWDQNTCYYNVTPATARLEQTALRWLLECFDLPRDCGGAFVTGANVANFVALAATRNAVLAQVGWKVEADGLFGAPPVSVVVGDEAHPTLIKALGLLGLGRTRVVRVPVDAQGRLRPAQLPAVSAPAIICTQVGNVNTGACDDVGAVRERVGASAWIHVDAAFGLWARAAPSRAHLVAGLETADSWATDAHKWLNVPYDSGIALVRDADALRAAMAITAEYLPTQSQWRNPSDYTPELSRRARGVDIWAALRSLGRAGLAELIERNCRQARRFAEALAQSGFEVLNEVALNQVLVACGDADRTQRFIAALQDEGTCWCGGTVWQGRTAMRISVSSWATTDADVEASIAAMRRVAATLP
jgi:glutamate/tyrosine decarboxylase-like PLP-dependent enzyme